MKRLESDACWGCEELSEVVFPKCLEAVESRCFSGSKIERLDLSGTRVVRLGAEAFAGCARLRELLLPTTLEEVGMRRFEGRALWKLSRHPRR